LVCKPGSQDAVVKVLDLILRPNVEELIVGSHSLAGLDKKTDDSQQ